MCFHKWFYYKLGHVLLPLSKAKQIWRKDSQWYLLSGTAIFSCLCLDTHCLEFHRQFVPGAGNQCTCGWMVYFFHAHISVPVQCLAHSRHFIHCRMNRHLDVPRAAWGLSSAHYAILCWLVSLIHKGRHHISYNFVIPVLGTSGLLKICFGGKVGMENKILLTLALPNCLAITCQALWVLESCLTQAPRILKKLGFRHGIAPWRRPRRTYWAGRQLNSVWSSNLSSRPAHGQP